MKRAMDENLPLAVVGAKGVVGREILAELAECEHAPEHVLALGTDRSEGEEVGFGDETLELEKSALDSFRGIRIAIFATPPDASRTLAPAAQAAGAWAIDLSDAFAKDANVPLAHPLRKELLDRPFRGRIVRVPSVVSDALLMLLWPLRELGLERVTVTALVPASASGERGVALLEKQTAQLLSAREPELGDFPHRVAFNLIPQVGPIGEDGHSSEERRWADELGQLWDGPRPAVEATAILAPLFYGVALTLAIKLSRRASADEIRERLGKQPEIKLLDQPAEKIYPMPMLVTADRTIHVGRVRVASDRPEVSLYAVLDNAGRAACLALDVADLLEKRA
jgi:aspartate-semialdehyde dehydrogenase